MDVIQGPLATPPSMGLLAAAVKPADVGWELGFQWRPETCLDAEGFTPCGDTDGSGYPDPIGDDVQTYFPPGYRVRDTCTTFNRESRIERLRRRADAVASSRIGHELWTGDTTRNAPGDFKGTPVVNPYLADGNATVVTATGTTVERLAALEEAARDASDGQQIFLHVPTHVVLPLGNVLYRRGTTLFTPLDSVVVAEAGYPGTGEFVPGTAEVQTVTITGVPTAGTFTLTYAGSTTGPIAFNALGAAVQAALVALPNLEPGDVVVTGGAGGPYTVTFSVEEGNVAQMTADGALLTGGTAPAVNVATGTGGVPAAPAAGIWAYATGPVAVRRTPMDLITGAVETVDRAINSQTLWAQVLFAATFDPCVHYAVRLDS
jgi:hypothetical protein